MASTLKDASRPRSVRSRIQHLARMAALPVAGGLALLLLWSGAFLLPSPPLDAESFSRLATELSEEPGYFDTDNLISNEDSYQQVVPELQSGIPEGGVYLGVGPDQNFTYIVHTRPALAFFIDIRRENQLLHLYYKVLFQKSSTRSRFLSRWLALPLPPGYSEDPEATAVELVRFFGDLPGDDFFFERVFSETWAEISSQWPGLLREGDEVVLRRMAAQFAVEGLRLKFRSYGRRPRAQYPTLARLILERDAADRRWHYLDSAASYQTLRQMQIENRLIPVVGDLAGPSTLRKIAAYLEKQGLAVTVLYTSNVEFYLFRQGAFEAFAGNVAALPIDPSGKIVRSFFGYGFRHPDRIPGYAVTSLLQSLPGFVEAHRRQPYVDYWDLLLRDYKFAAE